MATPIPKGLIEEEGIPSPAVCVAKIIKALAQMGRARAEEWHGLLITVTAILDMMAHPDKDVSGTLDHFNQRLGYSTKRGEEMAERRKKADAEADT